MPVPMVEMSVIPFGGEMSTMINVEKVRKGP